MALLLSEGINLKLLTPDWKSSFGVCFCAFNPIPILLVVINMSKWRSSCCWTEQTGWVLTVLVNELTGNLEVCLPLLLPSPKGLSSHPPVFEIQEQKGLSPEGHGCTLVTELLSSKAWKQNYHPVNPPFGPSQTLTGCQSTVACLAPRYP